MKRFALLLACLALGCKSSSAAKDRKPLCPSCPVHETVWVGDMLLADAAQKYLDKRGHAWPFEHMRELLKADSLIGNAEGPITDNTDKYNEGQRWSYNADPAAAAALKEIGFTAMSLGNNHLMDRGPAGVDDTMRHLGDAGIGVFGGGLQNVAAEPYLLDTEHGKVAIVGFGDKWKHAPPARKQKFGVIPFNKKSIAEGYKRAKDAGAYWVVAYVHWGKNYAPVRKDQRKGAKLFADAGYDLVVGHGPHVAQTFEMVGNLPVLYSLGNFTFGTPGRWTEDYPGYGLVLRTFLGPTGFDKFELSCIVTDNTRVKFQPKPCEGDEATTMLTGVSPVLSVDGNLATWTRGSEAAAQ